MTWRERALRAKKSGWLPKDFTLWANIQTCPAAEIAAEYGVFDTWGSLWSRGNKLANLEPDSPTLIPPDEFLTVLDEMEDLALNLKQQEGKLMFHRHHWHRFKTTLKYASVYCSGEKVRWFRCCRCWKTCGSSVGLHLWAIEGEPETENWYDITKEEETHS